MINTRKMEIKSYKPGEVCTDLKPFDIILTRRLDGFMGKLIAMMDGGFYCHAAMGYDSDGFIAEALEWGLEVEHINKYTEHYFAVVRILDLTEQEKRDMRGFMDSVIWAKRNRYGYGMIVAIALSCMTNMNIMFGKNTGTSICSGFVCETLKAGVNLVFPKTPAFMTPNDMAEYFGVEDPHPNMKIDQEIAIRAKRLKAKI
jgi:hypothetical protein